MLFHGHAPVSVTEASLLPDRACGENTPPANLQQMGSFGDT